MNQLPAMICLLVLAATAGCQGKPFGVEKSRETARASSSSENAAGEDEGRVVRSIDDDNLEDVLSELEKEIGEGNGGAR